MMFMSRISRAFMPSPSFVGTQSPFSVKAANPKPIQTSIKAIGHKLMRVEQQRCSTADQVLGSENEWKHRKSWSYMQSLMPFTPRFNEKMIPPPKSVKQAQTDLDDLAINLLCPTPSKDNHQYLENYIFKRAGGIARFNRDQLNYLYQVLSHYKAYDVMVEMLENCPLASFREDPNNLIKYGKANLKSHYCNPVKVLKMMDDILKEHPSWAEAYLVKGKVHALKSQAALSMIKTLSKWGGRSQLGLDKRIFTVYLKCFPPIEGEAIKPISVEAPIQYREERARSIECFKKAQELRSTQ